MHTYKYALRSRSLGNALSLAQTSSTISRSITPRFSEQARPAAMDMGHGHSSSPSSSSSVAESETSSSSLERQLRYKTVWSSPPKRPAGRTKFRETRHPVYRGVRRRGGAGRWVCEDSAWLLAVPPAAPSDLADVRRAATEAVAGFLQRSKPANAATVAAEAMDEAISSVSASPPLANNVVSSETPRPSVDATTELPAAALDMFELDFFGEMDYDMYYASLAEGLLMEPPPPAMATSVHWDIGDCGDEGADIALWSY
ncbi:hypothetical protein E2562_007300 [Oryza meyeriana var. granulata]|uniref:AP2/ERF domain-containing protein n=1 Tax=Oryza meyeriana var. granulata TaxID=110450 RepID=A0A6G1CEL0_9ORYZ|nr:hypothetical protein E2562_007300 [Oryza meyeriana var. granulata]